VKRIMVISVLSVIMVTAVLASDIVLTDLSTGLRLAELEHKQLIVMFSDKNCYYCVKFVDETIPDERVKELLRAGYVFVEIQKTEDTVEMNLEGEMDQYRYTDLYAIFGVRGTPTFWFFSEEGQPLTNLVGYVPAGNFVGVLQFLGTKAYLDGISFQDFLKEDQDFTGEQMIITLERDDAEYILANDSNARVFSGETSPDPFSVWVTEDAQIAESLIADGVYRVVLISGE